ncbi:Creatinase/aminopeptidase [Hyaloscypha bicolor E]|uniref:Probable Xaa-Pro aminopeptidase P n=1 Tax=Hyaloscypha bicolor E TaxID=1095630 RepID=A0A2J6TJK7_9HELO|nr:Creatinase/aminopeptidase [Hyaloscypha bicolor E]PMD63194.1 Creatinase/aminopeptidase [Hyaloscypha bicolor E]
MEKDIRKPLLCPDSEQNGDLPATSRSPRTKNNHVPIFLGTACFLCLALIMAIRHFGTTEQMPSGWLERCAWRDLSPHVHLLDVAPIAHDEFLQRQSTLAAALDAVGVDAFIAEPSASSSYYVNISTSFELSERPFLMIIDRAAQFSYLAPKFEAGRIARLEMVYRDKKVIEWPEEKSPYKVLATETGYKKIMLDEHARFMIASGLQAAGVEVVPTTQIIQSLRAVKTEEELKILRGINDFTLQLVRSLQKCIKIGMTQETVVSAASRLFGRAGVGNGFWAIVLFGDQAAYPHGGSSGKTLSRGEFVLIDIGSKLHDYGSDVTRTILPTGSEVTKELMDVWYTVQAAQAAAIELMNVNETCSVVDAAARKVITDNGYGEFFTHRLGHGLGLEMHEHPYLNGANGEKLRIGEVVTNEPGIYVTTDQAKKLSLDVGFGVRLEDPILVSNQDRPGGILMTGSRAKSPYEP